MPQYRKNMGIFGGFANRAEAVAHADRLGQEYVLISVLNGPLGMPLTPLAYFPLTRSLIREMYVELKRKPKEDDEQNR